MKVKRKDMGNSKSKNNLFWFFIARSNGEVYRGEWKQDRKCGYGEYKIP